MLLSLIMLQSMKNIVFNISPFDITKYNTRYETRNKECFLNVKQVFLLYQVGSLVILIAN